MGSDLRIGISGWTYAPWRGVFYPDGLSHAKELGYASRQFNSIEINGTHYSLQRPEVFRRWYDQTPEGFVFSVKASRYITHLRRLRDVEIPLANFFASGVLGLEEKLGPFLWQFPPGFQFDADVMNGFLKLLPKTTSAAAKLAARHDEKVQGRSLLKTGGNRRLRHCLEVRHSSFLVPEFFGLLRRYHMAFVFADTAGKWPYAEELTSDFVYVRLHGDRQIYVSGYTAEALQDWAGRIRSWRDGEQHGAKGRERTQGSRDVYVYFDNDVKVRAPFDAQELRRLAEG
ncbi:DUF72 domain-containing protein [Spartobacteria bacterium LR76]|nr:DUF72 domain-containing protein [Spartobacteria bacterium LR76]